MREALLKVRSNALHFSGIARPAFAWMSSALIHQHPRRLQILLLPEEKELDQAQEDLEFHLNGKDGVKSVCILPYPDTGKVDEDTDTPAWENRLDQVAALTQLATREGDTPLLLLTTPAALGQATPERGYLADREIRIHQGDTISFSGLITRLNDLGYDSETEVEAPGQFAIRGGIIDLYPVNAHHPYRLDFFGDEVDDIRSFHPGTQRSTETCRELIIAAPPREEVPVSKNGILDYLPEAVNWISWEPAQCEDAHPEWLNSKHQRLNLPVLLKSREDASDQWFGISELDEDSVIFTAEGSRIPVTSETLESYRSFPADSALGTDRFYSEQEEREKFFHTLQDWQKQGFELVLTLQTEGEKKRLLEYLHGNESLRHFASEIRISNLSQGFRVNYPKLPGMPSGKTGLVLVTDAEIFGRYRRRLPSVNKRLVANRQQVDQLLDFAELAEGDYLVHLQHGICIYRGIGKLDAQSGFREVISLEFDEGIILHVPLHDSHLLSRYVGLKKFRPKLGKVGSNRWEKTRRQAEEATLDLAAKLLNNQAQRDTLPGHAFSPDNAWQREFEASFPFQETPDQLKAIESAKQDMQKSHPMDRLVCGDVGFGKTEVALRAAFKAVLDGKQVVLLGPTTVLTQQHFQTFKERMASFPVTVEMLNRFRNRAEQTRIITDVAAGKIDIIIGTHRLLSKDIGFKDLGLVIIDEEHRFGVKHKEKLKDLRLNVDVLSLSATPIPRTLHLALMGARDLSVIETAPVARKPIKTVIKNFNFETVAEAIRHEMRRGGQVFYLHNRVQSIHAVEARLAELMPDVRFAVGHGQMSETTLERVMTRFVEGKYDVLIATTIIESGLDIPNANTIIIEAADRFGLSQLYQIRGRVGRFNRQAYAYLLLHRHARVLDVARKRLAALKQYNQLGAGFRIAMRDLELRGAGNLLGSAQSGHIAGVGFDLYCQLLRQSIARLKGEKSALRIRSTVRLDFVYVGERGDEEPEAVARDSYQAIKNAEIEATKGKVLEARVPMLYIRETRLRIDVYRQLAMTEDLEGVREFARSLEDRYGKYPPEVKALIEVTKIRCIAEEKGIDLVECEGDRLKCRLAGKQQNFIQQGGRFPRLAHKAPFKKLQEILQFIHGQRNP